MSTQATRYHDISAGHRVVGHEAKCRHLHGHNYRIHFTCEAKPDCERTDTLGRVIDFTAIKERLCMWVENNWDHKFLAYDKDPLISKLAQFVKQMPELDPNGFLLESIVYLPFNPTAENMARYLVEIIGPYQLAGTNVRLVAVLIEETAKCHASYSLK
jgi:6-pyruvoyltetrahydropterin/6-carboxytetrahydropterin synthase